MISIGSNSAGELADVSEWIAALHHSDPLVRERSRLALVQRGGPDVTAALVTELSDPREHVRWEAAKALTDLRDPVAAPAFLAALDDANRDVRWVAGEGLIGLAQVGLVTVLFGLTKQARSMAFCHSAHHVLTNLARRQHGPAIQPVVRALESHEPAVAAPPAAYEALLAVKAAA